RRHRLRDVETSGPGDRFEIGVFELRLSVEELVVNAPEPGVPLLRPSGAGEVRRGQSPRMERERLVLPHHADARTVVLEDALEGRLDTLAERTLEVGK